MALPISSTNSLINSINTQNTKLGATLAQMSAGQRITKAADDAAGLAISEKLNAQISSIDQAVQNVSAGGAMVRTAEGGMGQISDLLSRGRELAMQSANGTMNDRQRQSLDAEFSQIKSEIDRITQTTEFNGRKLLTGDLGPNAANPVTIQAGVNNTPADRITIDTIQATDTQSLGVANSRIDTPANALATLQSIDNAVASIAQNRANVGALENRFTAGAQNLSTTKENLMAADSQIRGLDYAAASSQNASANLALHAGVSALKAGLKTNAQVVGSLLNIKG